VDGIFPNPKVVLSRLNDCDMKLSESYLQTLPSLEDSDEHRRITRFSVRSSSPAVQEEFDYEDSMDVDSSESESEFGLVPDYDEEADEDSSWYLEDEEDNEEGLKLFVFALKPLSQSPVS
jgi:hypothetical protein